MASRTQYPKQAFGVLKTGHEALYALRSLKPRSRLPKSVLHRCPRSNFKIPLLSLPQGVELRLPFTPLDNHTQGRPTTNSDRGMVPEFPHHRSYTGVT
ncbi:hypothetical protein AVEN_160130-1 [Araneus ventricosus]|uniref:Uncharacterized protein n=1 Tax=Araneus ventricosus TaxID=182803 RepID=A0A4Y2TMV1_ARAVE|nr:hypothetical protein AVEN_160130-1 [Araneus ventricosus]